MKGKYKTNYQNLFQIAEEQEGYFTAQQAKQAGYAENTHPYHIREGNWERELRGIYRLKNFPFSENADLVIYSLWSRNREGVIQGIYSHQTALSLYNLSDILPSKLHLTVPPAFRRSLLPPEILVLHRKTLKSEDIEIKAGYRVTTPLRSILDLLLEGEASPEILQQALTEAVRRGLIRKKQLHVKTFSVPEKILLENLAKEAGI